MTAVPSVLMLVINPMTADARVDREARALGAAGFTVTVLATHATGTPEREDRGDYTVLRLPYRRVIKDAIVTRRRTRRGRLRDLDHGVRAAIRHGRRGRARALRVLVGLAHLLRLRLAYAYEEARWAAGGLFLKSVRSRILPAEYWRGSASRALDLVARPDVIHAHDLGTVRAALRLAARWRDGGGSMPSVVYDSHEYYVEQNTNWTRLESWLWRLHERRLIRRVDAVITVSDGIADALRRRYGLQRRPVVIHNAPTDETIDLGRDVRADAGLARSADLAVYVGGVKPGRGVEHLVPVLELAPSLHLAILGAGHTSDPHLAAIAQAAADRGVAERLHLLPAVPSSALTTYLRTADIGVHPMEPTCLNHDLALPNKLFDYIFAGLPVAVSDLAEMRRFVRAHGVGQTFDPYDPSSVAHAISTVLANGSYRPQGEVALEIRDAVGWPTQRRRLLSLYDELGVRPAGSRMDAEEAA